MKREAIGTGRTVEEAINNACEELGVERERIDFDILEHPSKRRLLGLIGPSEAKVKVFYEVNTEDRAKSYLKEVLSKMDLGDVTVEATEKDGTLVLDMEGEGLGIIIGHRGETLDALQYLVSLVGNRGEEDYKRIALDTGNYREKRERTLTALARRIAINAVKTKRPTTLEPMNPYERRIIHTAVQEIRGATSWSVGEEPHRKVVIGVENGGNRSNLNRKPIR